MNGPDTVAELERRIAEFNTSFHRSGSLFRIVYHRNYGGWDTLEFLLECDDNYYIQYKKSTRHVSEFLEHLDSIVLQNLLKILSDGKYMWDAKTLKDAVSKNCPWLN